jgi:succinate-acetate transporter protein
MENRFARALASFIVSLWILCLILALKTTVSKDVLSEIGDILETIVCFSALMLSVMVLANKTK